MQTEINQDAITVVDEDEDFNRELMTEDYEEPVKSVEAKPEETEAKIEEKEVELPPREEVVPGYTKEELAALLSEVPKLKSTLDKTNGTYGHKLDEQQKTITALQAQLQEYKQKEFTQKQVEEAAKKKLTGEKLEGLYEEYPGLADRLAPDLDKILNEREESLSKPVDNNEKIEHLEAVLAEERQARQREQVQSSLQVLKHLQPDWENVAGYSMDGNGNINWNNPAFGNWLNAQPEDVRKNIIASNDPYYLASVIDGYKKIDKKTTKTSNLAKSVQPKGLPSTSHVSTEDEEDRLFNAELLKEYD